MFIKLSHRHYGVHSFIKELEIPCKFNDVYIGEDNINEKLLLEKIPDGWLPTDASKILLCVEDEKYSTGQRGLNKFRNWAKYFDAYVLDIGDYPTLK